LNSDFKNKVFKISNSAEFSEAALKLFQWQYQHVPIYQQYVEAIKVNPNSITRVDDIPCLPISFFKSHKVLADTIETDFFFSSSGTTGQKTSKHFVPNIELYKDSFLTAFNQFYGNPKSYCILALLPAYLERKGSSLVYMADQLIDLSEHSKSGFYLNDFESLRNTLEQLKTEKQKTILLGVSFGLLDFIENEAFHWPELTVMETGGMKGRRKEMIRKELHEVLSRGFGVEQIHSEYGMTELLSQAYSKGNGIYRCPPWMKAITRDTDDPFSKTKLGVTGGLNIIDLANMYSCAFIATEDLAKIHENDTFEVLGRFDAAEVRGCNLMVS
jgi:phenylacetate-coenzyme A ligase PaaK-like adenylate-forming protein